MLVIGLTGGIASGKTLVSRRFAASGIPVIDADALAREVVEPGTEGLHAVIEAFGERVLLADGQLDRGRLRDVIFNDDDARQRLESIIHPRIRAEMNHRLEALRTAGHPVAITVIPLLVEVEQDRDCDRVLVVDAPDEIRIDRTCRRDGIDAGQARAILARQADRWTRLQRADDVIDNSDEVPPQVSLDCQIGALVRKYRLLADLIP